jgi:hypothetical protein
VCFLFESGVNATELFLNTSTCRHLKMVSYLYIGRLDAYSTLINLEI